MRLLVATRNAGKLREIRGLLGPEGIEVVGLADLPAAPDVLEGFQLQTVTSQTWRLNHDYIFSPRLLNHLTLGADRYVNPYTNTTVGQGWDKALGITGLPGAFSDYVAVPEVSVVRLPTGLPFVKDK